MTLPEPFRRWMHEVSRLIGSMGGIFTIELLRARLRVAEAELDAVRAQERLGQAREDVARFERLEENTRLSHAASQQVLAETGHN